MVEIINHLKIRLERVDLESFQWYSGAQGFSNLLARSSKGVGLTSELLERIETACSTDWPRPT